MTIASYLYMPDKIIVLLKPHESFYKKIKTSPYNIIMIIWCFDACTYVYLNKKVFSY